MCKFKSGLILKNRIFVPDYDSHEDMLKELNIEYDNPVDASFVRFEYFPEAYGTYEEFTDFENRWSFKVDQDILPKWYERDCEKYINDAKDIVRQWVMNHTFVNKEDVIADDMTVFLFNSTATLWYNSTATLWGKSTAKLWDNSTATLWDNSTATLYGKSTAILWDNSTAILWDNSTATLRDKSTAKLWDNSTATLWDNSTATLYGKSTAILWDNSTAILRDNSTAILRDNSTATLWDNSTATLWDNSVARKKEVLYTAFIPERTIFVEQGGKI